MAEREKERGADASCPVDWLVEEGKKGSGVVLIGDRGPLFVHCASHGRKRKGGQLEGGSNQDKKKASIVRLSVWLYSEL